MNSRHTNMKSPINSFVRVFGKYFFQCISYNFVYIKCWMKWTQCSRSGLSSYFEYFARTLACKVQDPRKIKEESSQDKQANILLRISNRTILSLTISLFYFSQCLHSTRSPEESPAENEGFNTVNCTTTTTRTLT